MSGGRMMTRIATALATVVRSARIHCAWKRRGWSREVQSSPISFSQHGEDLVAARLLQRVERFIDVGAHDGITFSNTFRFALCGSRGLCVEPIPEVFVRLRLVHWWSGRRVVCVRSAVSDREGIRQMRQEGLFSRISESGEDAPVPCLRLQTLLERYPAFKQVDLVSLDVEGHEWEVLQGVPWTEFRTRLWILETHRRTHRRQEAIDRLLCEQGYTALLENAINTFYVDQELRGRATELADWGVEAEGWRILL